MPIKKQSDHIIENTMNVGFSHDHHHVSYAYVCLYTAEIKTEKTSHLYVSPLSTPAEFSFNATYPYKKI